jgi:hypothetical protein
MTGQPRETTAGDGFLGTLDDESVDRIDVHLRRASQAEDADQAKFHVRHARQLLEACKD